LSEAALGPGLDPGLPAKIEHASWTRPPPAPPRQLPVAINSFSTFSATRVAGLALADQPGVVLRSGGPDGHGMTIDRNNRAASVSAVNPLSHKCAQHA
jgi:hypothetical protein